MNLEFILNKLLTGKCWIYNFLYMALILFKIYYKIITEIYMNAPVFVNQK